MIEETGTLAAPVIFCDVSTAKINIA